VFVDIDGKEKLTESQLKDIYDDDNEQITAVISLEQAPPHPAPELSRAEEGSHQTDDEPAEEEEEDEDDDDKLAIELETVRMNIVLCYL